MLSIVIPTLNDGHRLPATLNCVNLFPGPKELIVSDGGSGDQTFALTAKAGGKFYMAPEGRGHQLLTGANAAVGDWLLFIHADTRLGPGWVTAVNRFMASPQNRLRAAYFIFALDDTNPRARSLEQVVAWRCKSLSLPYGDQGLLISRVLYDHLGGYRPLPLMEDVDLVRRIPRHRLECLPALALTSAERYQKGGYLLRPLKNLICLSLFMLGVSPRVIRDFYS